MSFAILDDLSGVTETPDGFGIHPTRLSAIQSLILHLESDRSEITTKIANAKRARARETRKVPA